jgi:hypothetical protein
LERIVENVHGTVMVHSRSGFKSKETLLDLFLKQKIIIGMSPRQPSREFYGRKQRSILGFGVFYKEHGSLKCKNIDFISHNLNQTGNSTVQAFK